MWWGSNWCCSHHAASKYTFRVYIYITELDLLFRGPTFNYNSTTRRKLKDSIKGLLILCSILNEDVKEYPMTPSRISFSSLRSVDGLRLWEKAKLLTNKRLRVNLGYPQHTPQAQHQWKKQVTMILLVTLFNGMMNFRGRWSCPQINTVLRLNKTLKITFTMLLKINFKKFLHS